MNIFGKRYIVVLLQRTHDHYERVEAKKVPQSKGTFSYKQKTFKLSPEQAAYLGGPIYYDIDNCEPITFEVLSGKKRPEDLQSWMKSNALQRLVSANMIKIFLIIIAIVAVAGVLGTAYGQYQLGLAHQDLFHLSQQYLNATMGGMLK